MTDKQAYFLEQIRQQKAQVEKLSKEAHTDNPYDYTMNSMFEWLLACYDSLEKHAAKRRGVARAALDFDHFGD